MTLTLTLLDKGKVAQPPLNNAHERSYVTYTTPSTHDRDWSLTFTEASSPPNRYYYAVWRFLDDDTAKDEYPIFRQLAMSYNWAPIESRPIRPHIGCNHPISKPLGETQIDGAFYPVFLCSECNRVYLGGSLSLGKDTVTREARLARVRVLNEWHRDGRL